MTDKKYADEMTVDELLDIANKKRHESQWVGDGKGWYSRYIVSVSEICQQIVPEGAGYKCASHFMQPDGIFTTIKDAMDAFDNIENPFQEKPRVVDIRQHGLTKMARCVTMMDSAKHKDAANG